MSLRRSKNHSSRHSSTDSTHSKQSLSNSSKLKYKNPEEDTEFSDVPDASPPTETPMLNSAGLDELGMSDEMIARRRSSMIDFDTLRHDIFDEMNSLHGYLQLLKIQYPENEDVGLAMSQCNNIITMVKNLRGIKIT